MDKGITLMKKGEKEGGWEEHGENEGIERKREGGGDGGWWESGKQKNRMQGGNRSGERRGWRETRVEGGMEEYLTKKKKGQSTEKDQMRAICLKNHF